MFKRRKLALLVSGKEGVSPSQNTPLGDKGNPQVTAELDKLAAGKTPLFPALKLPL